MNKRETDEIERFEKIYVDYKLCIYKVCLMFLNDHSLAEDATQETFYRVLRNLHTFKNKSDIKTWITKIAINVCKNILKSKPHSELQLDNYLLENSNSKGTNIDEKLTVIDAINMLDVEYREVVILYYFQQFTHKEIAGILNIPFSTVAYRIRTAKEKLKILLKEEFDG